ncbi:MAG: hypothetical protein EB055_02355 [Micrococcales bacterium]|nr:hypothetical protein [Micrococcales bacterium]
MGVDKFGHVEDIIPLIEKQMSVANESQTKVLFRLALSFCITDLFIIKVAAQPMENSQALVNIE